MKYDNITAIKILSLIGHFAYLIKIIPEFIVGVKFEFECPLNERLIKQIDNIHLIQDILDISDINFNRNILSVKSKKNIPFARIVFDEGFDIKQLLELYPTLKLPTCEICGSNHYHIPGSGICYAKDFSYHLKQQNC